MDVASVRTDSVDEVTSAILAVLSLRASIHCSSEHQIKIGSEEKYGRETTTSKELRLERASAVRCGVRLVFQSRHLLNPNLTRRRTRRPSFAHSIAPI